MRSHKQRKPSIRKGCIHCGKVLVKGTDFLLLRTCRDCATNAGQSFEMMAEKDFKGGVNNFLEVANLKKREEEVVKEKINTALMSKKQRRKIEKRAVKEGKKRGLTAEQIKSGFENVK